MRPKRFHERHIGRLRADENGNPSAHGGVDRNVATVHAHLPQYGAVPTGVSSTSQRPTYTFEPTLPIGVFPLADHLLLGRNRDGWEAVDEVLAWMRSGPLANAWTWAESSLPVWFDRNSRDELRTAAAEGELDELMERRGYLMDQAENMDW